MYGSVNWVSIGSDNGLSSIRRQAIIWTNGGILLIGLSGTNFSEILIEILTFSFKKMRLKRSSAKWRPFCLGLFWCGNWTILSKLNQHQGCCCPNLCYQDISCHAISCVREVGPCLPQGRIYTTCTISVLKMIENLNIHVSWNNFRRTRVNVCYHSKPHVAGVVGSWVPSFSAELQPRNSSQEP